jgi:hypothetical protein
MRAACALILPRGSRVMNDECRMIMIDDRSQLDGDCNKRPAIENVNDFFRNLCGTVLQWPILNMYKPEPKVFSE